MKTPSGQPRSGTPRIVSTKRKNAGGSSAQPVQSMRGWDGHPSRNRLSRGVQSSQVQGVRGWSVTRSTNKKGR